MKRKTLFAILLFFIGVLIFTRIDFLVNATLYNYGLQFSEGWYNEYTVLYTLCYHFLILVLFAYAKNFKLFVFTEIFVWTCTQDLIYFGLWEMSFPQGEWNWMPFYKIFGTWTTAHQIILSLLAITLPLILLIGSQKCFFKQLLKRDKK